ncbi:MAG: ABC transporter ATP-binding protein [Planctomycetes bacterium]|nr:ABC transporter ATP-binding protein [Planctomycetota bacterium]
MNDNAVTRAPSPPPSPAPFASRTPLLRAAQIHKTYVSEAGSFEVLRGIDVEIRCAEILAIMGQSGVGKSTLLNILGLLDHPSQGTLQFLDGGDALVETTKLSQTARARLRNRRLGFVFQFYHLLPDLDVVENVMLPSMITCGVREFRRRKAELRARARGLLEQVRVLDRDRHRPNMLSGGERQRVAIARALMNSPALLLCDEPTGNLDTATCEQIHDILVDVNRSLRTTILIVTHDESLAARAHRLLHMVDGRFVDEA